jgi:hypothetical protein
VVASGQIKKEIQELPGRPPPSEEHQNFVHIHTTTHRPIKTISCATTS